jgi:predicted phage gp36 major capsid-like protein
MSGRARAAPPEYRNAFSRFIQVGERGLKPEEQRALSVGSDAGGGFTVASEEFVERADSRRRQRRHHAAAGDEAPDSLRHVPRRSDARDGSG